MTVSYAPMFCFGDYETQGNAERYATEAEAERSARERFAVWTMPTDWFIKETMDEVTYCYTDTGRTSLKA
tara:strand:+ start:4890 stop:5099 length:210 start_codon:yes stop_codon:yes gene_type:complete